MTAKELREAAERLETTPPSELNYNELIEIRRYILANVQEDGEEAVTAEWMKTTNAVAYESNGDWKLKDLTGYWYFDTDGAFVWHHVGNTTAIITTRSQLRALCKGLNIPSCVGGEGE